MTIPIEEQTNETVGEGEPDLKKQVEARIKQNSLDFPIDIQSNDKMNMDSKFVLKCLEDTNLGHAEIYKKLFRDKFIFNLSGDYWMYWTGFYWKEDKKKQSLVAVVDVARVYEKELWNQYKKLKEETAQQKAIKKTIKELKKVIKNLKTLAYEKQILEQANTSENGLIIDGDKFDKHPWLLPCNNGVINLKTGELEKGRQSDFLSKYLPVDYPEQGIDEAPVVWEKTLLEIFSQNQELVDFFQRLCGYTLIGEVVEHIFVVLNGRGRNGKSLIIETISSILGELSISIRSEMLLSQYNSNGSGADPGLMKFNGARSVFASETDDGKRFSPSKIKLYSGNDTLVARNLYDKYEVSFKPSHTLFLATNNKPHAPADDFAFWERMLLIPFDVSFVNREVENDNEKKANPDLPNQLKKEYSQILGWMIKGCLMWQKKGLCPPLIIKKASEDYREEEDVLQAFIDECCVVGDSYEVGSTAIYERYKVWWKENISKNPPLQKPFSIKLHKKFTKKKNKTIFFCGLQLREEFYTKEVIT